MRQLIVGSKFILPFIALSGVYWLAVIFTPRTAMSDIINGMLMALAITVIAAYIKGVREALSAQKPTRVHHLVVGIVLAWAVVLATSGVRFTYTNLGRPDWMINHPVVFYMYFVLCMSAVLHLTAPNDVDRVFYMGFSRTAAKYVAFAFGLGCLLSFAIMKWVHVD